MISSNNPIGNCKARYTGEQGKETTKLQRDGAGNPGPVYSQKDQAPDPRPYQNQTKKRQKRAKQTSNRADETGQSDSQEAKRLRSKTPKGENGSAGTSCGVTTTFDLANSTAGAKRSSPVFFLTLLDSGKTSLGCEGASKL